MDHCRKCGHDQVRHFLTQQFEFAVCRKCGHWEADLVSGEVLTEEEFDLALRLGTLADAMLAKNGQTISVIAPQLMATGVVYHDWPPTSLVFTVRSDLANVRFNVTDIKAVNHDYIYLRAPKVSHPTPEQQDEAAEYWHNLTQRALGDDPDPYEVLEAIRGYTHLLEEEGPEEDLLECLQELVDKLKGGE